VIKSRRMQLAGHLECMEKMRNVDTCLILIRKHQRRILYLHINQTITSKWIIE